MVDSRLRIGVAGAGQFGRVHLAAIRRSRSFRLTAIADPDPVRLSRVAEEFQVASRFADAVEMTGSGLVDAVAIVSPSRTHLALTKAAVAAGVAALVEKPIAGDLDEAGEMLALSRRGTVVPAHISRFGREYRELKTILTGDEARIGAVSGHRHRGLDHLRRFPTSDPILMTMIHDIDLALWYTADEAVSVSARQYSLRSADRVDLVVADVVDRSRRSWQLVASWLVDGAEPPSDRFDLYTDRGVRSAGVTGDWADEAASGQLDHFAAQIRGAKESVVTVEDAVRGIAIAAAIAESARQDGQPARVRDVAQPTAEADAR